mgnify:CR=1 FL=1
MEVVTHLNSANADVAHLFLGLPKTKVKVVAVEK